MYDDVTRTFTRSPDCVTREVAGELLVVPVRSRAADVDSIYTLNGVGACVWQGIEHPATAREIEARVCEEFDASPAEAACDVEAFLARLVELGLARTSGGGA